MLRYDVNFVMAFVTVQQWQLSSLNIQIRSVSNSSPVHAF